MDLQVVLVVEVVEVNVDGALCEMNNLLCSISAAAKCANCICQRSEPRVQIMCTSHIRTSHTPTSAHMHTSALQAVQLFIANEILILRCCCCSRISSGA